MFAQERQEEILAALRSLGKVTVDGLCARFGVSAPTVRADLASLEARGLLRRTHGGALPRMPSVHEPPFDERADSFSAEKRRIADAASAIVSDGETILLDAGTTCFALARSLLARVESETLRSLTIVTNNLPAALLLMDSPAFSVIVVGGALSPHRRATLGPGAIASLSPLHADRLFLGVNGIDSGGLTVADLDASSVKQAMIAAAREVVVVADSGKIGVRAFAHVVPLSAARALFVDNAVAPENADSLIAAGLAAIHLV